MVRSLRSLERDLVGSVYLLFDNHCRMMWSACQNGSLLDHRYDCPLVNASCVEYSKLLCFLFAIVDPISRLALSTLAELLQTLIFLPSFSGLAPIFGGQKDIALP